MAEILDGKLVAGAINERLKAAVEQLKTKGVTPTLAIVRVGARGDDVSYEKGAVKRCETVGVVVKKFTLAADATQQELLAVIGEINKDNSIHGCLLFRPLPKQMNDEAVRNALAPEKDIDGITDASLVGVFTGTTVGYPPCTAQACMEILDYYGIDPKGKRAVVVGRSLVVGKPAAMMLLGRHATVTICHTRTADMPAECRRGEILIVSAGRAKIVGKDYLSPGQVVIDVGINVTEDGKLCGDVDFEAAQSIVGAITPVPGGVGTVTTSVLVKHVVQAAKKSAGMM